MKIILAGSSHWHAGMHLDAARAAGGEIIGVWDEDQQHAKMFARSNSLRSIDRFDDVLAAGAGVILLMGHPRSVPGRARRIIEAGIPLILEKPAASSTEILSELLELTRQRNAFVSVPFPNRFGPAVIAFRKLQRQGRAGAIAYGHFRIVNGPPERYAEDGVPWMVDPGIGGGGALRNLGIHGIDAALDLAAGTLRLRTSYIGNRIHNSPVEDHALLVLEDEAGAIFTVEAGYTFASMRPGGDFEWRIVSANATLIDHGDKAISATLDDGAGTELTPEPTATRYRLCMRDTFDRLARNEPATISLSDYVAAMSLIDTAYRKARE
ncbi:Gfo/Idh/MocA family oxidoreductase [Mesorhizobium sp. VK22B]|uniref:Gfo/Idh/MocA family oxidoreductase n=1 Tax=Mesorhizobium captivum TaxID=3072319 RepID=A0ABU4Z1B0_9HYPH|nr:MULTISPECIES: Gfo/Idh/MocA family oxidoreductase [unclassified Mesorhizobium]MDX8493007.1 Gfo/Idh/MocA family oxidoreductase [Mesorhizobium sp. VK22B]MDX8509760.1 Gfo/Idh/MocA family oxidoreductase [Mesorhizobium sp. VK22E]